MKEVTFVRFSFLGFRDSFGLGARWFHFPGEPRRKRWSLRTCSKKGSYPWARAEVSSKPKAQAYAEVSSKPKAARGKSLLQPKAREAREVWAALAKGSGLRVASVKLRILKDERCEDCTQT
jgi:hypothetical protein